MSEETVIVHATGRVISVRRDRIEQLGLRFDTRIKPAFEDGHFTACFVLALLLWWLWRRRQAVPSGQLRTRVAVSWPMTIAKSATLSASAPRVSARPRSSPSSTPTPPAKRRTAMAMGTATGTGMGTASTRRTKG